MRAQPRRAFIAAAMGKGRGMEGIDLRAGFGEEGGMDTVAGFGGLAVERREDENLRAFFLAIGGGAVHLEEFGNAERAENGIVKGERLGKVIGAERDVTEHESPHLLTCVVDMGRVGRSANLPKSGFPQKNRILDSKSESRLLTGRITL